MKEAVFIVIMALSVSAASAASFADEQTTAVRQRLAMESAARDNPFLLLPHRPNYILPVAYNQQPNDEPFGLEEGTLDRMEMKFQVSLKAHLAEIFLGGRANLYAAYTSRSWWQTYNSDKSRPFRETNHEPELFLVYDTDWKIPGFRMSSLILGGSHQSNGQGGDLSRSWNRVYANLVLEREGMAVSLKPWYRIPERKKDTPDDPGGDDNPDIRKYMGSGELGLFFRHSRHTLTIMVRNNLRRDNRGAFEIGYSYPMRGKIKGYFQFFEGYGESLIDYDHRVTRAGVGILLADWL